MPDSDQSLTIRVAADQDASVLSDLLKEIKYPVQADELEARLKEMDSIQNLVLVAENNAKIVGLLTAHFMPVLHREYPVARITLLVVTEQHRASGVGRCLMEEAEHRISERGATIVEVISNRRYESAHGFYEHLGYELSSYKFKKQI